ncbi:MAG: hypothetical protein A2Y10_12455 [Planctomycetes bacterium GWF2_41_51]|nr:MAG: hypothetical protein A2Y10_12455 [Planctomycetes bacterium GWF2_41_51]HBG27233.1 hypothetical protein [Phycisphaerales bacterium]
MKCHILYKFRTGPWGGANQFLKALKKNLEIRECYSKSMSKADVVLCNLNPAIFMEILTAVRVFGKKHDRPRLIVRIDGPVSGIRGTDNEMDRLFIDFINIAADGVLFQSEWSRQKLAEIAKIVTVNSRVITNAPDKKFFNKSPAHPGDNQKIRLIANSWSPNPNKGFEVYKYLDDVLDFSKYEFTFIGNSPVEFKNIKHIKPLDSKKLAKELKQHHIYITASRKDPCSNSLIEALHCGLPAIAYNDGGHPEIIGKGGRIFELPEEIPFLLEDIAAKYQDYFSGINLLDIDNVTDEYLKFFSQSMKSEIRQLDDANAYEVLYTKVMQIYSQKAITFMGKMKTLWK